MSLLAFVTRLRHRENRLLEYMLAVQIFTYISAPLFSLYMLGELKLNDSTYMVHLATAFLAKATALADWFDTATLVGLRAGR